MTDSKGKARFTIYLSPEINQAVRHLAVDKKLSVSEIIQHLLKESLQKANLL